MAIFSSNKNQNLRSIMKKIKISRTTFYRHHGSTHQILVDYEKYMILEFKRRIKNIGEIRVIYWQMLMLLLEHKDIVIFSLKQENGKIIEKIVKTITLDEINHNEIILEIYQKEIIALIEVWIKTGFKKDEIEKILNGISHLTKTVRTRLDFFNI